jgi:GntR family transcriptional regulator, transcriptional repressor for pyruvate dehydrogenase complex
MTIEEALTQVAQPRAHEYVAEQIRRVILLRLVAPGGRLPYEQELAAALGVSRTTVTQALRALEGEGLVEVRRGRGGGVFTQAVSTDGADPSVARELRDTRDEILAAAEARATVEPAVAELAAGRMSAGALDRLEALNAEMRASGADDHRFMGADTAFHMAVAAAAGNPMLSDVMERIRLALARALEVLPDSPAWHERSVAQHADLIAALGTGDGPAARLAAARHLEDTERALRLMLKTVEP